MSNTLPPQLGNPPYWPRSLDKHRIFLRNKVIRCRYQSIESRGLTSCERSIGILYSLFPIYSEDMHVLKFHLSPVVVSRVESTPTGSSPQVGPSIEWSIEMRCLP